MKTKFLLFLSGLIISIFSMRAEELKLYMADWNGNVTTIAYEDDGLVFGCWTLKEENKNTLYLSVYAPTYDYTFDEQNRPIFPEGKLKLEMPLRNLKAISLSEIKDNVENIAESNMQIDITRSVITLTGEINNIEVSAYTLDGVRALRTIAKGETVIDLTTLATGVYIVNIGNRNFKIFVP